jgi:hypothetical protein
MAIIGYCNGGTVYHCERCGTVKHPMLNLDAPPRVYVPKLVERCRTFRDNCIALFPGSWLVLRNIWERIGLREAINLPENRP